MQEKQIPVENLIFSQYHLPYNKYLKQFSRDLRNNSELAEILLWNELKAGKMHGYTFNRQKPILNYIADFYCKPLKLVIEIDGASHFTKEAAKKDKERDRQMKALGLRVLRISDSDVRKDISNVLGVIEDAVLTPPNPLREGEVPPFQGGRGDLKPFDKARYEALKERLEVSEVLLSNISFENSILRIDAEYFKKDYLNEDSIRLKYETVYLGDEYFITDGQHGYHEIDNTSEIRHLTAKNFLNWFADDNGADRLAKWVDDANKRSSLKENDVILTTRGTVGYCALVKDEVLPANIDQDVARIAYQKNCSIIPHYLVTYLNSKYGRDWTKRNQTGMVQQGLALWRIRELPVPRLTMNFQTLIKSIIERAHQSILSFSYSYQQAETLLLETLDMEDFQSSSNPINVKDFKESFLKTGRLDAEYYQVKYEQIVEKIKTQKYSSLISLVDISKSIEPGSAHYSDEKGLPFYRVSDYNKFGLSKPDKELTNAFVAKNKELITKLKPKKGTILFSKDGSVGTAYLLRKDLDGITSGAILHLQVKNTKEVLPEYLTLALNSKLVQMQAERDAGGSVILHWRVSEIENVVVPIIPYEKQKEIAELVEESFRLKKQSEQLLETAKKAVEIAIEENEESAMEYINAFTSSFSK